MSAVVFERASKTYGGRRPAVDGCSLVVEEGQFVVLLGPSGCGKTTLLKMVNRLIEPTGGRITVGGTDVQSLRASDLRRQIGYAIQQVGLFPHMSVEQNIAVVPRLLHWPRARIEERIDTLLELVNLPPADYRRRRPRQLSGGQQQRTAGRVADPADGVTMTVHCDSVEAQAGHLRRHEAHHVATVGAVAAAAYQPAGEVEQGCISARLIRVCHGHRIPSLPWNSTTPGPLHAAPLLRILEA
ncbi:MAG: hypothetical protein NVSMB65_08160 [Chloroflexota bacterium]